MSKLWMFADSYGVHVEQDASAVNKWFWGYDLAKKLKCNKYCNLSQMGIGNEYIQLLIMNNEKDISPEDYVVVVSSSTSRKWFIKDKPWLSNFYVNNLSENTSPAVASAVRQYVTHLHNPEAEKLHFHQFLGWVHYKTIKNNWNLIIVPGFEEQGFPISNKYQVTGSLFDICLGEFRSTNDAEWYYSEYCKGRDKRSGHLLRMNHKILTDKIYNTFTTNEKLDLSTDFNQKIISKSTIDSLTDQFPILDLSDTYIKGFVPEIQP